MDYCIFISTVRTRVQLDSSLTLSKETQDHLVSYLTQLDICISSIQPVLRKQCMC